jgi:peptidylprolyl isomerase
MIRAAKQDTVKVHYTGRLDDGTIFDQSPEDRPLHFIIGRQEVIAGFDEAVTGMYQGESKTVTIPCEQAYGKSRPELLEQIERSLVGDDVELHVGGQLEITNHDGSAFRVMVRDLTDDLVTLDANHPLAGKDLTFDITLLEVKKAQTA